MAKKQTRRSISVSRTTYERLKAFCETNHISMSQLVETRVNDFLGPNDIARPDAGTSMAAAMSAPAIAPSPRPASLSTSPAPAATMPRAPFAPPRPVEARPATPAATPAAAPALGVAPATSAAPAAQPPMTSAAARFAVDPPPPIIKPRQETAAPKPAEKRADQIFTF